MVSGKIDTKEILNLVINQVYNKAFDRQSHFQLPIRFVDDPEIAHSIFRNTKVFEKNYESWLPHTKMIIIEVHDHMRMGAAKFEALVDKANGGVLFIDEAHAIMDGEENFRHI